MDDNHTPLKKDPKISTPSFQKEAEPIPLAPQEMIEPIRGPEANKEVLSYIKQQEKMKIPPDLKNLGVQSTDDISSMMGQTFPISDEKIVEGLSQPINSSWRWLSEFLIYHLRQMHQTLKKVHGHIKRVATS